MGKGLRYYVHSEFSNKEASVWVLTRHPGKKKKKSEISNVYSPLLRFFRFNALPPFPPLYLSLKRREQLSGWKPDNVCCIGISKPESHHSESILPSFSHLNSPLAKWYHFLTETKCNKKAIKKMRYASASSRRRAMRHAIIAPCKLGKS